MSIDPDELPVFSEDQLWAYLHYDLGLDVSRRCIKFAVRNREIVPTRLGGGANRFSKAKAHAWLKFREQPEPGRPSRERKTVAAQ